MEALCLSLEAALGKDSAGESEANRLARAALVQLRHTWRQWCLPEEKHAIA
ncbi:hypothetical protein D3C77_759690 [compost metagenome]